MLYDFERKNILKKLFGVDPIHLTISKNFWEIMLWNKDEVPYLQHDSKLLDNLDKLKKELLATDRKTTPELIQYQKHSNILTNAGMTEMGKRNTGESSTTNSHHAVGRQSTTETLNDTELDLENSRKEVAVRKTDGQTERYSSAFSRDDIMGTSNNIQEAGIFTAASNGILMMRVTFDNVFVAPGQLATISTTISHQNGTE